MSSQFAPLLRNEIAKALRRKLPLFGIVATWVLCLLIYATANQLGNAATANAWGYVAFSMQLSFTDLGLIFTIMFAAMLLSEERGGGTIRAALAAPVHRWEFYLAKAAAGLLYMLVLSAATLLVSVALAKTRYDFGPIGDQFGVVYGRGFAARTFLLAYVLSWVPLSALVMYGLLISVIVRSPGAAVAVGISVHYLTDFAVTVQVFFT